MRQKIDESNINIIDEIVAINEIVHFEACSVLDAYSIWISERIVI